MIVTMSSNFSVNAIVSPPSLGTINPTRKAPIGRIKLVPSNVAVEEVRTKNSMDTDNVSEEGRPK